MKAISSPAVIGHDWYTTCPEENKIPSEWYDELDSLAEISDDDPDTSDALVLEGRNGIKPYANNILPTNSSSSNKFSVLGHKPNATVSVQSAPILIPHFNRRIITNKWPFLTNHAPRSPYYFSNYIWSPISRHPSVAMPIYQVPHHSFG